MSAQHTPGPWKIDPNRRGKAITCSIGLTIAGAHKCGSQDANARLIAAAPELLEALKECCADLVIASDNARDAAKTDQRWAGVADILLKRARLGQSVIAKAEGRS